MSSTGKHYEVDIDPTSESSHGKVLRAVGHNCAVLELGCAAGSLTRYLSQRGNIVTAIEIDAAAAARAAEFAEVIVADLDGIDLTAVLDGRMFDVAIAADVLEHVARPERVLEGLHSVLRPGGRVVASIPNVAHGSLRLSLLAGKWDYQALGLLDRTHLRFFTRSSILAMFEEAGYTVKAIDPVVLPIDSTSSGVVWSPDEVPADVVESLSTDPSATALQYVVDAQSKRAATIDRSPLSEAPSTADSVVRSQARLLREADESIRALQEQHGVLQQRLHEIECSRSYRLSHWIGLRRAALLRSRGRLET